VYELLSIPDTDSGGERNRPEVSGRGRAAGRETASSGGFNSEAQFFVATE